MPGRTKHDVVRGRGHPLLATLVLAATAGFGAAHEVGAQAAPDAPAGAVAVLFTNATIIDGSGAPGYAGDLLIEAGRIAAVGAPGSIDAPPSAERRDLSGLVLAPGFIDIHNHSTTRLFDSPLATTQLAQGITTLVVGADGSSPWPISDYLGRIDELRSHGGCRDARRTRDRARGRAGGRVSPHRDRRRDRGHDGARRAGYAGGRVRALERARVRPRLLFLHR